MAKFGCASMHQLFLQPSCTTMSRTTVGLSCKGTMQQQMDSSSGLLIRGAASHGGHGTSMMLKARRFQVVGMRTNTVMRSRMKSLMVESPSSCCLSGEVTAAVKTREDVGSMTSSAWLIDRAADISEWRDEEEEESVVGSVDVAVNEANQSRFELDSLIHGHVGRFAFLAILFMGVGVACLTNVGDATAATSSHINSFNDRGLDVNMRALAFGPEGPLLEEFWDNMRRYGLYFLTVVSGGVYQLVKPAIDALKNPVTAILIIVIVTGSIYLVGLTVSAMLGINEFQYDYAT